MNDNDEWTAAAIEWMVLIVTTVTLLLWLAERWK